MNKFLIRQKRNHMVIQFLWVLTIIDYIFYFVMDKDLRMMWPPVGLVLCIILTFLYYKKVNPNFLMYLMVSSTFIYVFYLNIILPYLVNFLFLFIGVIISAFYLSTPLLVYATFLCIAMLDILYNINRNLIFDYQGYEDFPYFILFGLFISFLLYKLVQFSNDLLNKIDKNEQKMKKDLHSTKSFFESLFKFSKDAICIMDDRGKILEINDAFKELFGYSQEEIMNSDISEILSKDRNALIELLDRVRNGESISGIELFPPTDEGNKLIIEATFSPIYSSQKELTAISTIIRNATEKKLMDEYLRNSEKLKVTGEIAAGVAHEIRNPLTVIAGFIQMLKEENSPHNSYYSIINSEISRMNAIISEFLILSKPHVANLRLQNVKDLLEEVTLLFVSESHFKNVKIHLHFNDSNYPVLCEGNQLKQVFINIIKNAFEAMPEGGEINIVTTLTTYETVSITISDTGNGMEDDVLKNIGTPFFTTKENGTGLGLMITERIIEQHKGIFKILSSMDKGTTAEIVLPITNDLPKLKM